jgi:ABC-type sugar transport system substrate-binding protein
MKYLSQIIVGLVAAVQLTAVTLPISASAEQLKKIAILPKTLVNDVFQIRIVKAAELEAKKDGIATETFASRSHSAIEDQINIIETLIARGEFGALIIAAVDSKGLGNVLDKAAKAGLYVVLVDSGVEKGAYVTTIGTNNKVAASAGAEFAASLIDKKGNIAMLEGEPGGQTAADRTSGFHEGIAKFPGIKLVASISGHWTEPGGLEATEAIIAGHKDLDLIFAASDMMGIGARQVLERAAQKAKEAGDNAQAERFKAVKIVGFDGVAEAFKAVKDGSFSGTVAQNPETMGTGAVDIAVQLMKGEKKPSDFPKFIDSGATVITKDNVDEIVKKLGLTL